VRIFLLSATPMRAVSGRSRPMRAGLPTGTHRCRSSEEAPSLLGRRVCLSWETSAFTKTLIISWSIFWVSSFVNSNTCYLICNNFNLNFIYGIVYLYVCVCRFSLRWESSDMILGDKPLIFAVVLLHWIRMKMVKQLIKGSTGAWLTLSFTSWWYGRTFSSLCAYLCAFKLPHTLHICKPFSGFSGISNLQSN
jgi:hypothetical protein